MQGCIAGCQYMPSAEFFSHWLHHGQLTIEACEHYQKRTWRNRTAILGKEHPLFLTVPLKKGKHQGMDIQKVEISYDEPWQKQHLESIKTAYGKTPFLEEILPDLERLYHQQHMTLWSLNMDALALILSFLKGSWTFNLSQIFHRTYPTTIMDLREGVSAGSTPLRADLIPVYPQVQRLDRNHLPNLCILDVLCHLGPETSSYLGRYGDALYAKES
jgi:hypothetical protein